MTPEQIQRVAAMGHALRPDWPVSSLATFIEKHLSLRGYGDTVVAMAWVASRTETQTPRLLLEAGVWWKAAVTDDPSRLSRRPPGTGSADECRTHPGEWRVNCRCCLADRKARRDEIQAGRAEAARLTREQAIAAARANIRCTSSIEETA